MDPTAVLSSGARGPWRGATRRFWLLEGLGGIVRVCEWGVLRGGLGRGGEDGDGD